MDWEEQTDNLHTPENPYCTDPACWCHTNVEYHDLATQPYATDDDVVLAYRFYEIARLGGA